MRGLLLGLIWWVAVGAGQADVPDLSWRLQARNLLVAAKQKTKPYFRDREVQYRLRQWLHAEVNADYVSGCQKYLVPYFHSYNVLGAICWAKRRNNNAEIEQLLTHYYLDLAVSLLELSEDPRYEKKFQEIATSYLQHFRSYRRELSKLFACFKRREFGDIVSCLEQDFALVRQPKSHIYISLATENYYTDKRLPYFSLNTASTFPFHAGHAGSETGWIGGNSTKYVTTTRTDPTLGRGLNKTSNLIADTYPFADSGRGSLEVMYREMKTKGHLGIFTEKGFKLIGGDDAERRDLVWDQKRGVYHEVLRLIDSAQETIFIDMFAFGGVTGVSLAKHLLTRLHENKNLKVFILRDVVNHFGAIAELMPVYNYLLAYSYLFPKRLLISESYIYGHVSGLPAFIKTVLDDDFVRMSGVQDSLYLAVQAVSDHSKVMVIDAKTANPKAIVSSKNWSDRTGVFFFDDAVVIEGPAAAVVQDDFYHDMRIGLKKVMAKKFPVGKIAGQESYIDLIYQGQQRSASLDYKISEILKDFDLLERDEYLQPRRKNFAIELSRDRTSGSDVRYPRGTAAIRTGYNSVDSSTTNIVDQNIQAILMAKKNIYINEQFCFDSKIITALLNVKSKRPHLDIKIILERALEVEPDGFPNMLYLDLLMNRGIEVRWKKTQWIGNIPQKNHSKTLSVDSRYLIVGSANKDSMTMFGSFRDQQVEVFDPETVATHDRVFMKWWHNVDPRRDYPLSRAQFEDYSHDTEYVFPHMFKVPDYFVDFEGKQLEAKEFLRLTRGIVKLLYDYVIL